MIERDPRRLFTPTQRFALYVEAGGRCQRCGRRLGDEQKWDAHHGRPHSLGGRTELGNGRALCTACHVEEHRQMDECGGNGAGRFIKDYGWQERAVATLMTGISDFYNADRGKFSHAYVVEVSPSGGKTKFSLKATR